MLKNGNFFKSGLVLRCITLSTMSVLLLLACPLKAQTPAAATDTLPPPLPQNDGRKAVWEETFSSTEKSGDLFVPKNWDLRTKIGTPSAVFCVKKEGDANILSMFAEKATATYLYSLSGVVDLKKTPIVRWCWRVKKLPTGGDGRDSKKDDQAIGLYIGTGTLSQDSIAYRWETETPKGEEGKVKYGGGLVSVKWYCLRNKEDGLGTWKVEERNAAEDFNKSYGYVPRKFALSVVCNSQYTGSESEAELAWVQFLPEK